MTAVIKFRYPTITDLETYKRIDPNANFYSISYAVYNQNRITGLPFVQLKRSQLKIALSICLYFYSYSHVDLEFLYRSIYLINGSSFNGLEMYERMPINKLLLLVKVHNNVQDELKASMDKGT